MSKSKIDNVKLEQQPNSSTNVDVSSVCPTCTKPLVARCFSAAIFFTNNENYNIKNDFLNFTSIANTLSNTSNSDKFRYVLTYSQLKILYDFIINFKSFNKKIKSLDDMQKELSTNKISRFQINTMVDLENVRIDKYAIFVYYGRKKTERSRFPHSFLNRKDAESFYDDLQQFVGTPFNEFVNSQKTDELIKKYAPMAENHKSQVVS
jgi:hypothetical protein